MPGSSLTILLVKNKKKHSCFIIHDVLVDFSICAKLPRKNPFKYVSGSLGATI